MLVSFFAGLVLLQPLKVMAISFTLACVCKGLDYDDGDDVDEDEEKAEIADEAEWHRNSKADRNPRQ